MSERKFDWDYFLEIKVISIEETWVLPLSVSTSSVDVKMDFFSTSSKNLFSAISVVSTARDIAFPLAFTVTSSAPLLNWVTTART
ncbi:hypothetical protein DSECCO2_59980 [anaerobic digester metagenome]